MILFCTLEFLPGNHDEDYPLPITHRSTWNILILQRHQKFKGDSLLKVVEEFQMSVALTP